MSNKEIRIEVTSCKECPYMVACTHERIGKFYLCTVVIGRPRVISEDIIFDDIIDEKCLLENIENED